MNKKCEVKWGNLERPCGKPATHLAYSQASMIPPLAVCAEHALIAERSAFRVEPPIKKGVGNA